MTSVSPLVSVCCITYNHRPFIREAIEGFLMQQTSFPYEILIHDDASTDGTAEIVREFADKHPGFIIPILQTENQWSRGVRPSTTYVWPRARGKYIALCEGDDYWTDPFKLQKQVDFLEKNGMYSACAHQSIVIYKNATFQSHEFRKNVPEVLKLNDLLDGRKFHTASVIFRTEIVKKNSIPDDVISGDRALNFLLVSIGPIGFINESMCVYRKSDSGLSATVTCLQMKSDLNMIKWIRTINRHFPRIRYASLIHKTIALYSHDITDIEKAKHLLMYIFLSFSYFPKNLLEVFRKLRKWH